MKISRWKGEAELNVLTDQIQIDGGFDLTTESRTETKDFEHGVDELHVTLNNRPRLDRFAFPIEMKNLVATFQPPLTAQEIIEGCVRPERIVNSYSLYHKYRRENEYKAGKFGHLLRLDIHDDAGMKEWCPYRIDENLLIIEPPKRFLDRAKFPLTVGELTFGKTDIGGTGDIVVLDYKSALQATLSEDGTVTEISAYGKSDPGSGLCKCGIYDDVAGDPTNLEGSTNEVTIDTTYGWADFPCSISLNAGTFWLTYHAGVNWLIKHDVGATGEDGVVDTYSDGLSDPWGASHIQKDRYFSIYATYTAAEEEEVEIEPFIQALTRGGALRSRTSFKSTFQLD